MTTTTTMTMDRRRIQELGREYDAQIRENLPAVLAYVASQRERLVRYGIDVGDFHLPLRPMFYSRDDLARIERGVRHLWGGLLDVYHHVFDDDPEKAADFLGTPKMFLPWLRRCFSAERDVSELFGRPDGFCWGEELRFIEQNTSSGAGGMATIDTLVEFFDGFPAIEALRAHTPVQKLSLLDAYATWFTLRYQGTGIGYMDAVSPETGERWDMQGVRFVEGMRARGIELKSLAYRQVEFRDDGPYFEGERIRCFYRSFSAIGMDESLEDMAPFFEACGRGEARMVTSPYEIIFFDKRLLPYLSDETLNSFLSEERRAALSRILPWTRFLRDYDTLYHGQRVNVPALCLERKDAFVLKKGDGCASMAVTIGAECDEAQWRDHVARDLTDGSWIVQELVDPPTEPLPYLHGTDLVFGDVISMTCPYLIEGHIAAIGGRTTVPHGGSRILANAGTKGASAGIRTAFCVG